MHKFRILFFTLGLTVCFISCKRFLADMKTEFSYWVSFASIEKAVLPEGYKTDKDGFPCITSEKDKTVILKLINPQNYVFKMPSGTGAPQDIVSFESGVKGTDGGAPVHTTDFVMTQKDSRTLTLTFKESFLKAAERGAFNIAPSIILYTEDGRKMGKKFSFNLKVNTAPPQIVSAGIFKTKTQDGGTVYVLCLKVPETDKTAGGKLLHSDIVSLQVETSSNRITDIPLKINDSGTDFDISGSGGLLLSRDDVMKILDSDSVPEEKWVLFFKTEVKEGGGKTEYIMSLKDEKGLESSKINLSTNPNKVKDVIVSLKEEMGSSSADLNADNTEQTPHLIKCPEDKNFVEIILSCPTPDAEIKYKLTSADSRGVNLSGKDKSPISLQLKNAEGGVKYALTFKAEKDNLLPSAERTIYYLIEKAGTMQTQPVTITLDSSTGTSNAGDLSNPNKESQAYEIISKSGAEKIKLTAKSSTDDSTIVYQIDGGGVQRGDGSGTEIELSVPTANENFKLYKLEIYAKKTGYIDSIKKTIFFKVSKKEAAESWASLKKAVSEAVDGSLITVSGILTSKPVLSQLESGEIEINKNLTIIGNSEKAEENILDANGNGHRIFRIKDGKKLTLKNITLKKGRAGNYNNDAVQDVPEARGGAVYIESGSLVLENSVLEENQAAYCGGGIYAESGSMLSSVVIKDCRIKNNAARRDGAIYLNGELHMAGNSSIESDTEDEGRNDVFIKKNSFILIADSLIKTGQVNLLFEKYQAGAAVLKALGPSVNISQYISKFVLIGAEKDKYKINEEGKLENK